MRACELCCASMRVCASARACVCVRGATGAQLHANHAEASQFRLPYRVHEPARAAATHDAASVILHSAQGGRLSPWPSRSSAMPVCFATLSCP